MFPSLACHCDSNGSKSCNPYDGVCSCKLGYAGSKCDLCQIGYFGFPNCQGM